MKAQRRLLLGILLLSSLCALSVFVLFFSAYSPTGVDLQSCNQAPSFLHYFGTDDLGRDVLVRTADGIRISLTIGLLAFLVDLLFGTTIGTLTAVAPPWLETLLMRSIELIYSLPYLLVVILISVYTGQGLIPIFCAILCIGWIQMAKIVYQLTKSSMVEGWSIAAMSLGASKRRLLVSHILPNITHILLATALLGIPQAIFTEAFLSFLGVGIPAPHASLGSMVSDALPSMRFYSWRLLFPAGTIILLIFSITLIQEALRDILDPYFEDKKIKLIEKEVIA
jgi:oligopeptide transport system permease protein